MTMMNEFLMQSQLRKGYLKKFSQFPRMYYFIKNKKEKYHIISIKFKVRFIFL